MNTLEITKEIKQVAFKYTTAAYQFTGTCDVTVDNSVTNINTQVGIKADDMAQSIGNCSSNNNTSINIYNIEYKDSIDVIAADFKVLCTDLAEEYSSLNI